MPRFSFSGLSLALSLGITQPALARTSFIDYSSRCAGAVFATCASVQVFTRSIPGGTYVEIRMRNQMAPGNAINGWEFVERRSEAWGGFNPWGNLFFGPVGRVGLIGPDPMSGLDMSNGVGEFDEQGRYLSNLLGYLRNSAIVGCDNNLPIPVDDDTPDGSLRTGGFMETCARDGFGGWVGFRFTLTTRITARDVFVPYPRQPGYGTQQVSVTPEPGTMVLLASGLAGVAGLRRRKSRR